MWTYETEFTSMERKQTTGRAVVFNETGEFIAHVPMTVAPIVAAAPAMLEVLQAAIPHISQEVEQRKFSGSGEDWEALESVEGDILSVIAAIGKRYSC